MPAGAELSRHDPDIPDWDPLPRKRGGRPRVCALCAYRVRSAQRCSKGVMR